MCVSVHKNTNGIGATSRILAGGCDGKQKNGAPWERVLLCVLVVNVIFYICLYPPWYPHKTEKKQVILCKMFVYLSKKIAIPNNVKLNCIAWNKDQGYIAVAGSEGLLKVLKLEQASNGQNKGNLAAVSNLSMNQTLDGHKEAVKVVTWNETQQKLTSSDLDGVIMVWMLYKGSWYEEMTNDRKKSTVNSMSWTSDGAKICIVYEDGAIIVGSVDGNRIWGKELKNTHLTSVQWSPDNRLIIFGLATGECHLYDNQGNFAMKLNIQCVSLSPNRNFRISALCWFSGRTSSNRPVLAICYETCKLQIMRNESDDTPVLIDTGMRNIDAEWNHDGSVLAICGTLIDYPSSKELNQVSFYSPFGQLLRTLKVPGYDIASLSWEGKSLRIAMAVDSFIYFANIRPDYMWCYFEKTVVFLNRNSSNFTRNATTNVITFWNTISNQSFLKEVEPALGMAACNEHCVIVVECLNTNMKDIHVSDTKENNNQTESIDKCYQLLLCNSIGTTVDCKSRMEFKVLYYQRCHFSRFPARFSRISTSYRESAKEYYEKSHHIEGLMDALYHLERFDELEQCIDKLPEKSPLLAKIAEMLASVGMCSEAVKAYLKMGDPKAAVNACVNLRQWGEALQLARKFDMPQIGNLLSKHAAQLIKEDRLPEAIELQKKAGRYLDAARLLGKLAQREAEKDASMLRIKKLYILAALLAEEHLKTLSTAELSYKVDRNSLLDTMTPEDAHVVEHMWHAAEAYHFMMLAQRQLRFGIVHSAVVTALRLRDYDDILPVEDVYNTLALASCADRSFGTCAKAFTKLESLEGITERRIQEYKELGASIFAKYASEDAKVEMVKCYACNAPVPDSLPACTICGARFPACVSSGKPITQPTSNIWICGICHHCATPVEITRHHTCPLCHSLIISMTLEI
ncbi:WD repeat-containing protein 35-like [Rhagoletis pomonella]|uniref:WD repeat-containing protein 35-like n=1 Tax=Rhagoletis pomonella TaxID=28610 RepID=UPI0017802C10|nr:WD repeat-containing protein 35-like [Rhagoletis pomonella]